MLHQVERADLSTAEGKDHLVSELRDVFADIPSSAVREDLLELVAERLALPPALVSSWMPTPERTSLSSDARPAAAVAVGARDAILWRCVTDPDAARALPSGAELARLFPDALSRRAAEHIRVHASDPAAELPDDDYELVSFITGLLTLPGGTAARAGSAELEPTTDCEPSAAAGHKLPERRGHHVYRDDAVDGRAGQR